MPKTPSPLEDPLPDLEDLPPLDSQADDDQPTRRGPQRRGAVRRRHRAVRSSTSSSDGSGPRDKKLAQINDELIQAFTLIGTATTPFAPVTGATLVAKGPQGADIVCNMARKDERIYKALISISKYAVYGELAMFVGTIGLAASVDMGQQKPDSFLVQRMLGDDWRPIMDAVYGSRAQQQNGAGPSNPVASTVPSGWGVGPAVS